MNPSSADIHHMLGWRYRVVRELGDGGTAAVFLADDLIAGRPVALKAAGPEQGAALKREYISLYRHRHPGLIEVLDLYQSPALIVLALEYFFGAALSSSALTAEQMFSIWSRLADVLGHLHQYGIVHGDLKPEHVLVDGRRVKLIDLGMSGRAGARSGFGFQGTVAYAAPELLSGQAEATMRSDIYGLGLVIWQALGNRPTSPEEKLDPGAGWCDIPDGELGPRAAEVLRRMLRFAPETRYASGNDVVEALRAAQAYQPAQERPELPFTGRGAELKTALDAVGDAGAPLTLISAQPGAGASRFLRELHFLLQVTGKTSVIAPADALDQIDWSRAPGNPVVLLDRAGAEQAQALTSALPERARLICVLDPGAETSLSQMHWTIALGPLAQDELEKLIRRFLHTAHPRDVAALARRLTDFSAGNMGIAAAYIDWYFAERLIEMVHGQWRFDWQLILGDRGFPGEVEKVLTGLWESSSDEERAAIGQLSVTGRRDGVPDDRTVRWRRFLGGSDGRPAAVAECLRRFVCARISEEEVRACLGNQPGTNDQLPDRVRWELLARLGLWTEWIAQGHAILRAAEADRDAEAIIFCGRALLESGRLAETEARTIARRLFRLSARMGREDDAERAWRELAALPGAGWEPALEAARFFAGTGKKPLAEECLVRSAAAAPADDPVISRRLNACRSWIGHDPMSPDGYPPELLSLAGVGTGERDMAAAEANEYLARMAYGKKDWKNLKTFAEATIRWYERSGEPDLLGLAYSSGGYGFLKTGDAATAETMLAKSIQLVDDGLPNAALSGVYENLAMVKIFQRRWDDASNYLLQAEQQLSHTVPIANRAFLSAIHGVIHDGQGDHSLVRESQIEAAALYFEAGDHANYAICLDNAAIEEHLLGNAAAADAMLKRALEHSRSQAAAHAELIVLKDLCRVALERVRHDEAWDWFECGRALSRDKDLRLIAEHIASGALAAVMLGKAGEADGLLALLAEDTGSDAAQCWRGLVDGERKVRIGKDSGGAAMMITAGERFLAMGLELEAAGAWQRAAAAALACDTAPALETLISNLVTAEAICQRHRAEPGLVRVRRLMVDAARQLKSSALSPGADPGLLTGIYELTGLLASATDQDAIAGAAVRLAVRLLDAERGGLFLLDGRSKLTLVAQVNLDPDTQRDALDFSREAVLAAAGTGREIVSNDAQLDKAFSSRLSVQRNAIRSLLAVPVSYREGAIGALYLDTRLKSGVFSPQRREFLKALAAIIGSVLESGRLLANLRRENRELKDGRPPTVDRIVGKSPAIRELLARIRTAAAADVRVLMDGETGTGKELAARAIHELSARSANTFLALDCGSLPENLLEAELFGSVKGAFTGAYADKKGLFEAAGGGTLFLDEITSASPSVQARLLRAIEAGEIRRVGDTAARTVDVRLICATNKDLEVEINEGRFKEDLYYRLNVVRLRIPPLRERAGDIMILAEHYRQVFQRQHKKRGLSFSDAARECLLHYVWPGNIRELEHVVKRAVIMAAGPVIGPADLEIQDDDFPITTIRQETDHVKRVKVIEALRVAGGNVTRAAKRLRMSRRQLQRLMKKNKID